MVNLIIQLIVALLIAGFLYWVWLQLSPIIARFVADPFMALINVLVLILIAAIVLFYAIIPLLKAIGAAVPRVW